MGIKLGDLEIYLGALLIIGFTAFIAYLTLQPATTTTTSSTTTTAAATSSSATSSTTTTSRTSTSTSSSTTSTSTTTTTMFVIECAADADCGVEHYDGTYICLPEGPTTALQKCTPKCVHGACTEKCKIDQMFDRCNRTTVCIPGWRRCVDRDLFENTTKVEVFYDKYVTYRSYQFRLNYTAYRNEYEVRSLLVDVILPDGERDQIAALWDVESTLGDMEVGIYGIKRDSAIIWLRKTI